MDVEHVKHAQDQLTVDSAGCVRINRSLVAQGSVSRSASCVSVEFCRKECNPAAVSGWFYTLCFTPAALVGSQLKHCTTSNSSATSTTTDSSSISSSSITTTSTSSQCGSSAGSINNNILFPSLVNFGRIKYFKWYTDRWKG